MKVVPAGTTRTRRLYRTALVCGVLCSTLSCAGALAGRDDSRCPVTPVSSTDLPASTRIRARVLIGVGDRQVGIEVVARNRPEELVVVGLASHGTRLFAVRQRDREIEIDAGSSSRAAHLARWVIDALHRGLWIQPSSQDDRASFRWEGEQIIEIQREGRWRREFRDSDDATDVAPVSIEYRGAVHRSGGSGFEIHNAWCGYDAVFIPLDEAV